MNQWLAINMPFNLITTGCPPSLRTARSSSAHEAPARSRVPDNRQRDAVTEVHPRPDFKNEIFRAFTDGFQERPDTTFGTMNADVLEHFAPDFHRIDFVDVIKNSAWPE
jgi:hypothetical protein